MFELTMFLYVIRHRLTGKEYVGITTTAPKVRWRLHQSASRGGSSMLIHQAIRSDGVEAFEMELIGHADSIEELWRMEEQTIRERGALYPHGYNRLSGGRPQFPAQKWSQEARERLRAVRKQQVTPEVRERLRQSHRGKTQTPETRAKRSAALKGRPKSSDHVRKATHPQTAEARQRISHAQRLAWASRSVNDKSERSHKMHEAKKALRAGAIAAVMLTLALFYPSVTYGQVQIDHATFTTAVTATDTTITLSAASGSSAGDFLYVEGELMRLSSAVNSSTTQWNVQRGRGEGFTPARRHSTSAIVWVLDSGTEEGPRQYNVQGSCTATTERYLPHINTKENRIFDCGSTGLWLEREREIVSVQSALTVCGGRYKCREEFNGGHAIMQDDGTEKSLTDAEENFVYGSPLGAIEYREELGKTASSWVAINGQLDVSGDNTTDDEGVEIVFGATSDAALNQVIEAGTSGACIAAMITVTDISGTDQVQLGWRQNQAFQDVNAYAGYTIWNTVGINASDGSIVSSQEVSEATDTDDSGINWADGERRALKVCISSGGVPTAYYTAASPDTEEPLYVPITMTETGSTLTAGTGLIPYFSFMTTGTDGPDVTIAWIELSYAP